MLLFEIGGKLKEEEHLWMNKEAMSIMKRVLLKKTILVRKKTMKQLKLKEVLVFRMLLTSE